MRSATTIEGASEFEVEIEPPVDARVEADRGRVDDDVRIFGHAEGLRPRREFGLGVGPGVQKLDQRLRTIPAAVHDEDAARAGERQFDRDRARRPAGAEHHHPCAGRIGDGAQGRDESAAVGVLPDERVVAAHHGVDRPDERGRFAKSVQMPDHRHLVGKRAVEPNPAHGARAADCVAEQLRRHFAIDVASGDVMVAVGRLDHRDRRILGRRHGEAAGQHRQEIDRQFILRLRALSLVSWIGPVRQREESGAATCSSGFRSAGTAKRTATRDAANMSAAAKT